MKGKHLGYEELLRLYKYISEGRSCREICSILGVNRSTLYRLIMRESVETPPSTFKVNSVFRYCRKLGDCRKRGLRFCPSDCDGYVKTECPKLRRFPYVCDFCDSAGWCRMGKRRFDPVRAYAERSERLRKSREGASVTDSELKRIDTAVTPLIKSGLSVEVVMSVIGESVPVTSRTIRNWIDRFYLTARRADMINAQTRYVKAEYDYPTVGRNVLMKAERTYSDFLAYRETRSGEAFAELDTVHGLQGERKCILTVHIPSTELQIGILLESCSSEEAVKALGRLAGELGGTDFNRVFPAFLADNGPEFDRLDEIERSYGTRVFFTRPYRSGDKGSCEKNHEFIRRFHPKGTSFEELTQEILNKEFSHINSYPRKSLGMRTPYERTAELFGQAVLPKLGIRKIDPTDLRLKR